MGCVFLDQSFASEIIEAKEKFVLIGAESYRELIRREDDRICQRLGFPAHEAHQIVALYDKVGIARDGDLCRNIQLRPRFEEVDGDEQFVPQDIPHVTTES